MRTSRIAFLILLGTILIPLAGQERIITALDFESGLGEWTSQGDAAVTEAPDGNKYLQIRMETKTGVARISSPQYPLNGASALTVSCRYRSTVPKSLMHVGSWLCVIFLDKDKKGMGDAGIGALIAETYSEWKEASVTLPCPAGAVYVALQPRLQTSDGRFDIDDISVRAGSGAPKTMPAKDDGGSSSFKTLAAFTLTKSADGVTLAGNGRVLKNENPAGASAFPYVFTLPDEFCENKGYFYEISATVVPAWSTRGEKDPHGVFALGANILGQDTNSLTIMLWDGRNLIVRVLPEILGARAEVRQPIVIEANVPRTVRLLAGATELSAWLDGALFGKSTSPREFLWPKKRAFIIGGERINSCPFNGEIRAFSIKVQEPMIRASFAGGRDFGYFVGEGPHSFELLLAGGIGPKAQSTITVRDIEGKSAAMLTPKSRNDGAHAFEFSAPFGWYRLETAVTYDGVQQRIDRTACIVPSIPEREDASKSIFGVTHEYPFFPDTINPVMLDTAFKRMATMGIRWFRAWIRWDYVEAVKGTYDWSSMDTLAELASKHGISIYACMINGTKDWQIGAPNKRPKFNFTIEAHFLPPLDTAAWNRYLTAFSARYKGKIDHYQVWNETDTRLFFHPFKADAYVSFMKDGYMALKTGNPDAVIMLGGFCAALEDTFFEKMTHTINDAAYGLKEFYQYKPQPYFEVFDYHFYTPGESKQLWESSIRLVRRLREYAAAQGDGNKPIWNGETGFASAPTPERVGVPGSVFNVPLLSERDHAARIVQWHVQSKSEGIAVNINYKFTDETFGPVYDDFSPKPAYAAHSVLASLIGGKRYERQIPLNPDVRAYLFKGADRYLTVLWTVSGSEVLSIAPQEKKIYRTDMFGNRTSFNGVIKIGEEPLYIESKEAPVVAPLISMKVPDDIIAGVPFDMTLSLNNPSAQASTAAMGVSLGSAAQEKRTVTLTPNSSRAETFRLPGTAGRVSIDGAFSGGFSQPFMFEKKIVPRRSLLVGGGRQAPIIIADEKQVVAGGKIVDAQARTVSESKWTGTADLSAKGTLTVSGTTASFEIEITDDRFFPADTALYNGDAAEIFIDLRTDAERTTRTMDNVFQVVIAANGKQWAARNRMPASFAAAAERNGSGYRIKGSFDIGTCSRFGFDVSLDDADDSAGRKVQMAWAGTDENHKNPAGYGIAVLQ